MKELKRIYDLWEHLKYSEKHFPENDNRIVKAKLDEAISESYFKAYAKDSGRSKVYNSAKKYLNKLKKSKKFNQNRLQYVIYRDGYQYFTDSYTLFRLKNHIENLPCLPKDKDFPDFSFILRPQEEYKQFTINVKDLKMIMVKADNFFSTVFGSDVCFKIDFDGLIMGFSKTRLEEIINILGFKNEEDITFNYTEHNKKVEVYRGEDMAIVLPVIVNDN